MAKGNGGARVFLFQARSTLPEGTCFQVCVKVVEQRFMSGRLVEEWTDPRSFTPVLKEGAFECSWEASKIGRLGIRITTPDDSQEMTVADQLKRVVEDSRHASFDYYPWDDALLARLDPQLGELSDLARDVRGLIDRVEAACVTEESFRVQQKALIAGARTLESRAKGFATAGLFPAGAGQIALTAGDLAGAMGIFTWKGGEFQGPTSYYTNHQRGKTFRGDLFEFTALRRYLDEAVQIGGREFDLWIIQDFSRANLRPALVEAVDRSIRRPGVLEFADRLKSEPNPALVEEIRRLTR
jgi:hypothetical protein